MARYLVFMMVAGVIAGFGVIEVNSILIVGAMAVSPDTLPVAAACVGLVSRRGRLARRSLATLVVGLGATCSTAFVLTALPRPLRRASLGVRRRRDGALGPDDCQLRNDRSGARGGRRGHARRRDSSERGRRRRDLRDDDPAAAYLGVAAGVGEADKVPGTLAVLAVNVTLLLVGGTATLLVQRRFAGADQASSNPLKG